MPWNRTFRFDDPLQCQEGVHSADVQVLPLEKGNFQADFLSVGMQQLWMQQFYISLPIVSTIATKPGRRYVGFLSGGRSGQFKHCGIDVSLDDVVVHAKDARHHRTTSEFRYSSLSLAESDLQAACNVLAGCEMPETQPLIRPSPQLRARLSRLHEVVCRIARDTPDVLEAPEVLRSLEQNLVHVLVQCLARGVSIESSKGWLSSKRIIARLDEFLEAHPNRPLYLAEICSSIGASERTLRHACEEHLGIGPIRFLTLRRMQLARRALLQADGSIAKVTQIATDFGFWELGRFSVAYRLMFGETPSQTLRRPPSIEPRSNRPSYPAFANTSPLLN